MHNKLNYNYPEQLPMSEHQILERAAEIIESKLVRLDAFTDAKSSKEYLTFKLAHYEREVFAVMILNSQHKLIKYQEIFFGTIDSATIHPREIVKAVLAVNGSAVILSHNHPSGHAEPSHADIKITKRLTEALSLIDVTVLDHIIVGGEPVSFAERGVI